jgi:F-type H+-transporting ATPase subunit delta
MEELIAKRYVQALLSVAGEDEKSVYIKAMNSIGSTFDDPKVMMMIESPIVSVAVKVDAVLSALGKGADQKLVNFIKILGEKKRLSLIPVIAAELNAQMQKESNSYEGSVKSKETLDDDAISELEETLKRYTGSVIKLNQQESDLDGLRVSVDDLGIEVNFSKERVKEQLIDFIMKSQ